MKTLNQSIAWLFAGLLMFSGCNNIEEPGSSQPSENELPPYSVTFRLGGSASIVSDAVASRADEIHNEAEKTVHSLYAVVFEDNDGSGTQTGTTGSEEAADVFYAAFPVTTTGTGTAEDPTFSFSLAKEGHFQVCFVANPSGHPSGEGSVSGLASAISSLEKGTSTVADFKALLESSVLDNPEAPSQYLMTSPFYTLATSFTTPQTIAEVQLTRAMARFDIINAADGYTITDVVFHNRAITTAVISDGATYTEGNTTLQETTYPVSLAGNSTDPTKCEATIYSFEQYAGNGSNFKTTIKDLPYLEIKYKVPSLSDSRIYSHNVYFKKAKEGEPAGDYNVLPIKRNTLYKIKMVNDPNAGLSFNITVLDWDKNTEISVSEDDLINNIPGIYPKPLEEAAIGDFYMKDGTLRDGKKAMLESEKANVIGIVFQTNPDRIGQAEKDALQKKGISAHGLVMAVKLANNKKGDDFEKITWGSELEDEKNLANIITLKAAYEDFNGLANYKKIQESDPEFTAHPVFKVVADFAVKAPEKSTDWFLPSIGQWWDIINNLSHINLSEKQNDELNMTWSWYFTNEPDEIVPNRTYLGNVGDFFAQKNINKFLRSLGEYADLLSLNTNTGYWSSSECNTQTVLRIYIDKESLHISNKGKSVGHDVRAILAF